MDLERIVALTAQWSIMDLVYVMHRFGIEEQVAAIEALAELNADSGFEQALVLNMLDSLYNCDEEAYGDLLRRLGLRDAASDR